MNATRKAASYVPSMSDAAVEAKTRKNWAGWFGALDKEGAAGLDHKGIVHVLADHYVVPGWWRRMQTPYRPRTA
jgi:hypothetical protein